MIEKAITIKFSTLKMYTYTKQIQQNTTNNYIIRRKRHLTSTKNIKCSIKEVIFQNILPAQ